MAQNTFKFIQQRQNKQQINIVSDTERKDQDDIWQTHKREIEYPQISLKQTEQICCKNILFLSFFSL